MSLIEKRVLMAKCDGCGQTYDVGDFVPYYDTAADAAEALIDSDWVVNLRVDPPTVHCPECAPVPDDDDDIGDAA